MIFRVDVETKAMVERAAEVERRSLTDYCLTALSAAAQDTLARHETLHLSERDRKAFFDLLINPPEPNGRMKRAVAEARRRIVA